MAEIEGICRPLLEKYEIERELGKGGGGCVYLAQDKGLGRLVALKHRKALTSDDQRQVERLLQEARTVASLRHPNVAVVYATERYPESGDYCVVMEYADGGTLADLLKAEGRLSLERALDIGIGVCTALEYVHRQGFVHGDIKPSNILFFRTDERADTKIADFGLSLGVQVDDYRPEGREGVFSGTLEYAAPELLGGESVDKRVDLYSLGAVLYNMLVGEPPFPFSGDVAAVIAGHLHSDLTPPQELRSAVFAELNELVLKALTKLPSERFQDAETMLAALREAKELCAQRHNQAEKLYNQGIRFEAQKKWPEAVESFEEACTLNPELRDIEQRLKDVQLQLELETTWHEVETSLAVEAWADALEQLGRISTLAPAYRAEEVKGKTEYARLQLDLATLYGDARAAEGAGRRREAIRSYVQIVSLDDSYRDATQRLARLRVEEDLESLGAHGKRLIQEERWEEAVETYRQMLDKSPGHPEATRQLGYAQQKLEIAQLYDRALDELERDNWDDAAKTLRSVTRLEPDYKDAAVRLAKVERRQQLIRLRQSIEQAIEAHQWSEADKLLEELLHLEHGDEEARQQRARARQWQQFEDVYQRGKADYDAGRWGEAIVNLEKALQVAEAAALDLSNYPDLRPLLDQAGTAKELDALREEGEQYEGAGDFTSLLQVLDKMLKLDPESQEVLQWKESASRQIRLGNLYEQASSRIERGDWAGAKRLLDEIASVDAGYKDVGEKRKQVTLHQGVSLARRWRIPLVIGAVLLLLFVPRLATRTPQQLDFSRLVVTPEFVGAAVGVLALIVSLVGLLVPAGELHGLLKKYKRLSAYVVLVVLLLVACLLALLIRAFVFQVVPPQTPTPTSAPVVVPTSSLTLSPASTPTETPMPMDTRTPTPTETPTPAGRQTPTPTYMPTPIRGTAATPIPCTYPRPDLTGIDVMGHNVTFKWTWSRKLAEDEYFALRVGIGTPGDSRVWTKETQYTCVLTEEGEYLWEVAICRGDPGIHVCEQLAVSEQGVFSLGGPGDGGGPDHDD